MRSRYSIINFGSTNLKMIFGLISAFVITPILLKQIGSESYGVFRVLMDIIGLFSLLELGMGGAISYLLSKAISQSDTALLEQIYKESQQKLQRVLIGSIGILLVVSFFIHKIISTSDISKNDLVINLFLCSINLFFLKNKFITSYIEASQKSYLINSIQLLQFIIFTFGAPAIAIYFNGVYAQSLAYFLSFLTFNLIIYLYGKKIIGKTSVDSKTQSSNLIGENAKPYFIATIAGRLNLFSDQLVISIFMPASMVSSFYLSGRLIGICSDMLQSFGTSIWASLSELYHSGEKKYFEKTFFSILKILCLLIFTFGAMLISVNDIFISVWVGKSFFAGNTLTYVVVLNCFFQAILSFLGWCLSFSGMLKLSNRQMLTSTFLNVLLSVVFTYFFGLLGPILGTLMTYLFYTFPKVIDMIASVFLFNKVDIYFSIIPSFVFMHIFGASGYFLVHESFLVNLNKKSDFLILLPITSLLFLLFFASGYIILLNNSDRRFVLDRFLSLKRIFKSS